MSKKNKKDNLPVIKILKYTDLPNGEGEMEFEYGQNFIELFKLDNPRKKPTEKNISKYLLGLIEQSLKEEEDKCGDFL
jgi:hypothetical protein